VQTKERKQEKGKTDISTGVAPTATATTKIRKESKSGGVVSAPTLQTLGFFPKNIKMRDSPVAPTPRLLEAIASPLSPTPSTAATPRIVAGNVGAFRRDLGARGR
jgi:hypothetical protein